MMNEVDSIDDPDLTRELNLRYSVFQDDLQNARKEDLRSFQLSAINAVVFYRRLKNVPEKNGLAYFILNAQVPCFRIVVRR